MRCEAQGEIPTFLKLPDCSAVEDLKVSPETKKIFGHERAHAYMNELNVNELNVNELDVPFIYVETN